MGGAGRRRGSKTVVTTEEVFQAMVDLTTANPPRSATRHSVAQELGVPYQLVDEKVDKLLEQARIRRIAQGVFVPTQISPDQVVSASWVPGVPRPVKLEIGDVCMDLTLRDVRSILYVLGGFGMQFDLQGFRRGLSKERTDG